METKALKIFTAVANTGSISRAAEQLQYVQSNVSGRIQQLEAELGTQLFHRKSRGVALTSSGRVLKAYAEKVLHLLNEASSAVKTSDHQGGEIDLGVVDTAACLHLPTALAQFSQAQPHTELTLHTDTSSHLVRQVLSFELDGAIISGKLEHPDLYARPLLEEQLSIAYSPQQQLAASRFKPVLLSFHDHTYQPIAEQWFREQGFILERTLTFGALDAILGCVQAGLGVTLLPSSVLSPLEAEGKIATAPLAKPLAQHTLYFIHRRDALLNPAIDQLLGLINAPKC